MKAFHFRLDRVLEWRRKHLDAEEEKARQRAAALDAVERERAELEAASISAEVEVRRRDGVTGADLAALDEFRRRARDDGRRLESRRAACVRELAAQQAAMLEARRRCRLLERLKERRWSEWKAESDRELDEAAAESYLARWGRDAGGGAYNEMHDP
jgi:hypothetical protein